MVLGYYHIGYEKPLLQLAWERGLNAAVAVKGEEGTSHYACVSANRLHTTEWQSTTRKASVA